MNIHKDRQVNRYVNPNGANPKSIKDIFKGYKFDNQVSTQEKSLIDGLIRITRDSILRKGLYSYDNLQSLICELSFPTRKNWKLHSVAGNLTGCLLICELETVLICAIFKKLSNGFICTGIQFTPFSRKQAS